MNDLIKADIKNGADWMSKKELMEICKCSDKTLEQIISCFSIENGFDTQNHIKKGGYHNSETFYDDYLVKLIQAKLFSNKKCRPYFTPVNGTYKTKHAVRQVHKYFYYILGKVGL